MSLTGILYLNEEGEYWIQQGNGDDDVQLTSESHQAVTKRYKKKYPHGVYKTDNVRVKIFLR